MILHALLPSAFDQVQRRSNGCSVFIDVSSSRLPGVDKVQDLAFRLILDWRLGCNVV